MSRFVGIFFAVLFLAGSLEGSAQGNAGKANTEFLWASNGVHSGNVITGAVTVSLPAGLHTNSNTPLEDFLIPTVLTLDLPEGVTVDQIVYPEQKEIITGGSTTPLAVYEEHFSIGVKLSVGDGVTVGDHVIKAKLRYQACDDKQCFSPKNARKEWTISVLSSDTPLLTLNTEVFAAIAFGEADTVAAPVEEVAIADAGNDVELVEVSAPDVDLLTLLEDFEVLGTAGGGLDPEDFIQFIDDAEAGIVRKGIFDGLGPIAIVLLTLVAGFGLNLTPCVLPLIPINLAIIGAGAQAGSKSRGFALGGTYGIAMAVVYGILGLIVVLTASSFGTINSSPWFNVGITLLFIVLGLAMFDVITIDFSKFQSKFNLAGSGKKGSFALAFGMGGISALLAGACVAPMLIQVIVYSSDQYNKGETMALALPFLLGVGMAFPWPFAGGGMSFLPKPGAWMVRIKQGMGIFILFFAAYYGHLAYVAFDNQNVDPDAVAGSAQELLEGGWVGNFEQGLIQAKAEGKTVVVDMWATWCKNCLEMDLTTFKDDAVIARMENLVKIKYQTEDLDVSPAKEVLKLFNGIGLPNYAVIRPKQSP